MSITTAKQYLKCGALGTVMLLLITTLGFSDTGHYNIAPETGVPKPARSEKVSLKRVIVRINVDIASNTVNARCIFAFQNDSKAEQEVTMGFPIVATRGRGNTSGIGALDYFKIFIGSRNPKLVIYSEPKNPSKKGQRIDLWFDDYVIVNQDTRVQLYRLPDKKDEIAGNIHTVYWKYKFMPEETQLFIIEYAARGWKDIVYITGTASLWKDKVDSMDVSVKYSQPVPFHYIDISQPNYNYIGDSVTWHYDDYEPALKESIRVKILHDWRTDPIEAMPKKAFEPQYITDVSYKYDKQYLRYSPEIRDTEDPNNTWGGLKSPKIVADEVALIRNEIFARHGYIFSTPKYKKHFTKLNWYKENPNYSGGQLNYIENRNVSYLKCIEDASKNMDPEFSKYFRKVNNDDRDDGILYYDNSMDGEPDHDDPRDQTYYQYEGIFLRIIDGCYSSIFP